ncbi:nucleoid-associated protein YgaU [Symbiobacterium terraclitae]|uniref:Nucleoid-associated protein YgaU n=1 Tax=Symbiobacterium terraclitae TaxID=557451 RepID=A0ABS4JXC0_9FIRM|nr:LysM domain-containing protein [Symbiobacterium terraclitae]MBP2020180.1 nucleoid-associated protein YgaU [Symbiobacterium terraclitae]
MQTMPTRTRTSLLIGGVAVLVVLVGLALFAVNQRNQNQVGGTDLLEQVAEPENGTPLNAGSASNTPATTTPATNTPAAAGTAADTQTDAGQTRSAAGESTSGGTEAATGTGDGTTPAMRTFNAVPEVHIVQPNETLYEISEKYYNTHIYAGDIEALNGLEDPNQIFVGMELKLPQPSELPGYSR